MSAVWCCMSDDRACLHLLSASPQRSRALDLCLRMLVPGDAVLLLEDGVNVLLDELPPGLKSGTITLACLVADIEARGMKSIIDSTIVQLVDDEGFVELVERFPLNQTWT